jgi:hypothetical protein
MQRIGFVTISLFIALAVGGGHVDKTGAWTQSLPPTTGEARILKAWQGDYPVARLDLLPGNQHENGVGFINASENFAAVWKVFKPEEALPEIDFNVTLAFFAHNTQFFNRIRIGTVIVKDGVAELLAMETLSAMPIEDKVAMSLVVVAREGITGVQAGSIVIPVD